MQKAVLSFLLSGSTLCSYSVMWSLKVLLPVLAVLTVNLVVAVGYFWACVTSDALYLILGEANGYYFHGYRVQGRNQMALTGAAYGFFWLPIVIYNWCVPRGRKFHLDFGPNTHTYV